MNEQIRAVKTEDTDGVIALLAESAAEDGHSAPNSEQVGALVRAFVDSETRAIYVAVRAGVIGYIAVHWIPFPMLGGNEGYISDLVVLVGERGKGVGSRLLAVVEHDARERGCARLSLNNRVSANSFMRGFYVKHEFRHRTEFANLVKGIQ